MGQIIRTCSWGVALVAVVATPAWAARDASPLSTYVQARMADTDGRLDEAAKAYSAAMTSAPGNATVAMRAFRQAVESGDKMLALRAARQLDLAKAAPPDAYVLLLSDRLEKGDWRGASLMADRIETYGGFDFMLPVSRAWIAYGERQKDPLVPLRARNIGAIAATYAREHEALMQLALKNVEDGATVVRALASGAPRSSRLRIQAAAQLAALGARDKAASLLTGTDAPTQRAKAMLDAGKPIPGAVSTPLQGFAALLARVSADLLSETSSPAALTFARLAQFADASNDASRLTMVQSLARVGQNKAALSALDGIADGSIYRDSVPQLRAALLDKLGDDEAALKLVKMLSETPGAGASEFARLGDLLTQMDRKTEAVDAYERAVELAEKSELSGVNLSSVWLLYGGALDSSGDWPKAKAALKKAVELAPDDATTLNHLGYAMLERKDNLPEATHLIAKASALRPDDVAIRDSLGWAYFMSGDTARAVSTLEQVVAAAPNESIMGEHLGDAYWKAGRRIDARYAWNAARVQLAENATKDAARLTQKIDFGLPAAN